MELTHFGVQDGELQKFESECRQTIKKKQFGIIENSYDSVIGQLNSLLLADLEAFRLNLALRHEETNVQQQILDIDLHQLIKIYNEKNPSLKQFLTEEKTQTLWGMLKAQLKN